MTFVRCCVVLLCFITTSSSLSSHLLTSLFLLLSARFKIFSKKLALHVTAHLHEHFCCAPFVIKNFISQSSKHTSLQIHTHTHTHKHRKKKRNKRGARDITLIVAMNSTPLPTSREYVLCVLTLLICFFLNRSHPPPPCFYFCIRIESHIYNVLTNFFSLINRNNNSGVTIEGEDITQTISFQTPVVGGSNNNNSRVPLHSVVVRFF